MTKELETRPVMGLTSTEKASNALDRRIERLEEGSDFVIEAMQMAAEHDGNISLLPQDITPDEIERWGSTHRAIAARRISRDAREAKKNAPMYLEENMKLKLKILDWRSRREQTEAKRGARFNNSHITVNMIQPGTKRPEDDYGVIDVTPDESK